VQTATCHHRGKGITSTAEAVGCFEEVGGSEESIGVENISALLRAPTTAVLIRAHKCWSNSIQSKLNSLLRASNSIATLIAITCRWEQLPVVLTKASPRPREQLFARFIAVSIVTRSARQMATGFAVEVTLRTILAALFAFPKW